MFKKILIANRGEIACRIAGTCQRLGIRSIAIGSEADQNAPHMKAADDALVIGSAEAKSSYLNMEKIIEAAQKSGAEAIHPGYGFLSENADFASLVQARGLIFIGPSPHAIRVMGEKGAAKKLALEVDIPVISAGISTKDIDFPLMIKAAYGGGGKGMRIVRSAQEFEAAMQAAQRESLSAFGNDAIILERYIENARHIEIQVLADHYGHVITLGERDCSLQRRHQKIIEEAPATDLDLIIRHRLHEDAVKLATAVGYHNAGTVEFLVDEGGNYYFLEMNTRLQVEHPVTEMIFNLDLVEWQIRIAAGQEIPKKLQQDLEPKGHAIEVRLNAEDPQTFLPSTGRINVLSFPQEDETLRIDTGIQAGHEVSIYYDSLLAKIIAWGETRASAISRMSRALNYTHVEGVKTNLGLLKNIFRRTDFREHPQNTQYLEELLGYQEPSVTVAAPATSPITPELNIMETTHSFEALILTSLWIYLQDRETQQSTPTKTGQAKSPWLSGDSWRLNSQSIHHIAWESAPDVFFVHDGRGLTARVNERSVHILSYEVKGRYHIWAILDKVSREGSIHKEGRNITLLMNGQSHIFTPYDPLEKSVDFSHNHPADASFYPRGKIKSPMPGRIIQIMIHAGEEVETGRPLVILEAMKMEHTLRAPQAGRIQEIFFRVGDFVEDGADILLMTPISHYSESPDSHSSSISPPSHVII